jgi:GNAT superfamily N-acetyltransferase
LQPKLASASKGNSVFIRVRNLEELHRFHQKQNVEIVDPLENKPWGMAGYVVREINGYYVVFAGAPISDREKSTNTLPQTLRVIARRPTVKEFGNLASAVGWGTSANDAMTEIALAAAVFAVVVEDIEKNEVIGCALLLGDNASFYYVKDVIVHPEWQGKRVGTAMMHELTQWLERNGADNAFVGLYTGENLASFYHQFGFTPIFGMHRRIERTEKGK